MALPKPQLTHTFTAPVNQVQTVTLSTSNQAEMPKTFGITLLIISNPMLSLSSLDCGHWNDRSYDIFDYIINKHQGRKFSLSGAPKKIEMSLSRILELSK